VQSLLELGMEPKEIATLGVKMQAEARQRAALQQKEGEADRKLEEEDAKAQQKEQIEAAKEATKTMRDSIAGERAWRQSQEEYNQEVQQYDADMEAYKMEKAKHANQSSRGGGAGGTAPKPFTKTPPTKPVPPTPGLFADKFALPKSRDEVMVLPVSTRFLLNGQLYIKTGDNAFELVE
jgi:hypothetical protein